MDVSSSVRLPSELLVGPSIPFDILRTRHTYAIEGRYISSTSTLQASACLIMLEMDGHGIFVSFAFVAFFFQRTNAQSYLAIDWSERTYGPDGPWNALSVHVGGIQNSTPIATQQVQIDLYPGSSSETYLPYNVTCDSTKTLCDSGRTWSPTYDPGTDPVTGKGFEFDDKTSNTYFKGPTVGQAITLGGQTVYQANLVSFEIGATPLGQNIVTYPNGVKAYPPLGLLALDAGTMDKAYQTSVVRRTTSPSIDSSSVWIPGGYLYNQGVIPSYSWGLHMGSAALDYPGSLVLGGYDKGRLIGPYTTFGSQYPTLLDIGIGVETGGSPFAFQNKTGLLSSDNEDSRINVAIVPHSPSLYLPPHACEAITKDLPVYFDQVTKYYLWNTSDPLYQEVVSSPSYLSFVFPPASGDSDNVNIKIPFALLNLTLTSPIVSSPVQYFPCQPVEPNGTNGLRYALGRAFLQGAFVGWNTNAELGWLAQAPGPGDSNMGLGSEGKNIANEATKLDVYDGTVTNYFAQSWSKHWTPLPSISTATNSTASPTYAPTQTSTHETPSMSTAVIAGVSVGSSIGLVAIITGLVLCIMRKRRKERASREHIESFKTDGDGSIGPRFHTHMPPPPFGQYQSEQHRFAEMSGEHAIQELHSSHRFELGQREIQELPWESMSRPMRTKQSIIYELGLPPTPRLN